MNPNQFRRPKRLRHTNVDGFIAPERFQRQGSVGHFDRHKVDRQNNNQVNNFQRPDGYQPTSTPVAGSGDQVTPVLPIGPRIGPSHRHHAVGGRFSKHRLLSKPNAWRRVAKRATLVTVSLIILFGGFLGWKLQRNTSKIFGGNILQLFSASKLKGEDKGRVTILLTGNSTDDPGHEGAELTDSIMLISIDTVNKDALIVSIPRDLWVEYGTSDCWVGQEGKINAAYVCGKQSGFRQDGYPDGGIGLLEKIIEKDFGIDINYYVKINYTAFKQAVNAVGGIDITINTGDPRGLYDGNISKQDGGPLKLSNGTQRIDGQTALNLARARCDTVCYGFTRGDFDRTEHQRQMLVSLKNEALSAGVLASPTKISSLMDTVGDNVETDFKANEIRRLYDLGKEVKDQNLKSIGLADDDINLVKTGMINGQSTVQPVMGIYDFSQIRAYMKRLTSNDPVAKEGATVAVLNGSGVNGQARKQADILADKGIIVKSVANTANQQSATTIIIFNTQKKAAKAYLEKQFSVTSTSSTAAYPDAKSYQVDFVIILGSNSTTAQ